VIWLLQLPALVFGVLITAATVVLSLCGFLLFHRLVPRDRLSGDSAGLGHVFSLASTMYAVLVAFVVVVVWEDFTAAENAARSEATAISDLLRDSEALPASAQPLLQRSLIDYTKDVVGDEFPRMRRGEAVEQQSTHLTNVWQTYIHVQPTTHSEVAFYREAINTLDELGTARKTRIATSQTEVPPELWVLLLGGGVLMLVFAYMFAPQSRLFHTVGIVLSAALMGFVLYVVFCLQHPFVGALSVHPTEFQHVLDTWSHSAP
jgi:Protein of unknown function (DUF4239)